MLFGPRLAPSGIIRQFIIKDTIKNIIRQCLIKGKGYNKVMYNKGYTQAVFNKG